MKGYISMNINVAAACLNQTALDWAGNKERIISAIDRARNGGARLLVLPEMCITGYGCEDAFLRPDVAHTSLEILREIAEHTSDIAVTLGLPVRIDESIYNCVAFVSNKTIHGIVAKQTLAKTGVHYEPRWFEPWTRGRVVEIEIGNNVSCQLGDLTFQCGDVCIGFEICEDAWSENRPAPYLMHNRVNLILNPSASHFAFGKISIREQIVRDAVKSGLCAYVLTNLVGNEAGRIVYDGGSIFAWDGEVRTIGKRFSFHDVVMTFETMHVSVTNMPIINDITETVRPKCIAAPFNLNQSNLRQSSLLPLSESMSCKERDNETKLIARESWETGLFVKEEEFARAVALGLFDYLRKSRAKGFVVSLSGGVDSSSIACLCAIMTHLSLKELGKVEFWRKFSYIKPDGEQICSKDVNRLFLTCVYQSTRNSSDVTRDAARSVTNALGASYYELDIDGIVQSYTELVSNAIGRKFSWETDDIALQNIQARVRAPGIWLLANIKGALLLATSNRSEAAVGYTTMDGDTCGGISPIAGVDKTFLRHWIRWIETIGIEGMGAIAALNAVTKQEPTAELRPLGQHQTDEADLMPYEVLDYIEMLAIRDRLGPVEVYKAVIKAFPTFEPKQCAIWVERFFKLWCINQWKRERYAPSFHLDDESLDPKTWCRFPILSGGFARELGELW